MKIMKKRDRSDSSHAILDHSSRKRKAQKIIRVLEQRANVPESNVLDIGTGAGYIASHIAEYARKVVSIDVVDERRVTGGYEFKLVKDETLPFKDESFDIVISNHVIEHVEDQQKHINETFRILKKGGMVYLATPNRLWVTDPHYRIPFINWMPSILATHYLKITQGKKWDIRPITVSFLKRNVKKGCTLEAVVASIIKSPEQYDLDTFKSVHPITKRLPYPLLELVSHLSPTILLVMSKGLAED